MEKKIQLTVITCGGQFIAVGAENLDAKEFVNVSVKSVEPVELLELISDKLRLKLLMETAAIHRN
jgi:hypothetical protein